MSGTANRPPDRPVSTVAIGILTYRRPEALDRCLERVEKALENPLPAPWEVVELLVVDNDPEGSAEAVAVNRLTGGAVSVHADSVHADSVHADSVHADSVHADSVRSSVRYVVEATPGIAAARNRALDETGADVLIFIDDDEIPGEEWPGGLLSMMAETGAALVGGPVHSEFISPPPDWVTEGRFFERDDPPHGSAQRWLRSGNLAIDLDQVRAMNLRFDRRFAQGEDTAFTRRANAAGLELRWSSHGAVTEFVADDRTSVRWRLRREYLAHRAWTRSTLDLTAGRRDRLIARLRTLAVAGARLIEGGTAAVVGVVTARKATRVEGAVKLAGVAGRLDEIVRYRRPNPSPTGARHLPDRGMK